MLVWDSNAVRPFSAYQSVTDRDPCDPLSLLTDTQFILISTHRPTISLSFTFIFLMLIRHQIRKIIPNSNPIFYRKTNQNKEQKKKLDWRLR